MMKNIEKQKQEIKKDNLENNANDLEKRVEETIHILNRIQLFLFLYWIINIIISLIC